MQTQFPGVAIRLHHLWLTRDVFVVAVLDVSLPHERLEVRAEAHAVWRGHVDHLDPAAPTLLLPQTLPHHEAVPHDQAGPPPSGGLIPPVRTGRPAPRFVC